ncbi:permease [Cyanobacterium stanieri LEGE 03274]|uniref:Permease n=1 Tax=Cyanobacterium stanieri LEGE 03274 TaxID=1828756 RepID=A0ABR9V4W4_9CHRO|nr:permease [Cyanobacterium stanieri]MBE9222940.1 permease [Cyanobacterium stanieri LEGE 03274]
MDHQIYSALTLFISLLVEAMPFLLFGVLLSSSLIVFLDEGKLIELLPSNPILGAFIGSFFGFCFPVCECGNIPVARRFLLQGLPTSVAISFLLAAPTINPVVLWSTYVAFRGQPEIFWLRIIFSLTIAIVLGCLFSLQKDCRPLLKPSLAKRLTVLLEAKTQAKNKPINAMANNYSLLQSGSFILGQPGQVIKMDDDLLKAQEKKQKKEALGRKFNLFIENVTQELRDLGGVLILGSAIASCIQVFIPREIILNIGQDTVTSIIAMMVLASVVSICSTVDSFFVLSFSSTFTTASLVAFLVFGPMIDIKAMGLMLSIFKPRMIFYLMVIIAQFTFIFTLSYSYFF